MSWIKPFIKGSFGLYCGNTIDAFQPLDFFHFYPLWYDLWVKRIVEVIKKLDLENRHFNEIKEFLPPPSNMRAILQKLLPSYKGIKFKNPEDYKIVADFFARMLYECCPNDPFGEKSTPLYSNDEVENFFKTIEWSEGNPIVARQIGHLITATGSLVHGLYNDVCTDFGWDAYGPFSYKNFTLLIRHFPDLQPKEIWSTNFLPTIKELKVYSLYEDVELKISCVGCHTMVVSGNIISGLKKYAVLADGKYIDVNDIEMLIQEFALKAETIYLEIRKKNFEELKEMVTIQECYQLKKIFDLAQIDWKPTLEIYTRIKNKQLLKGLIPHGVLMNSEEEYINSFGIRLFAKEVLGEDL